MKVSKVNFVLLRVFIKKYPRVVTLFDLMSISCSSDVITLTFNKKFHNIKFLINKQ